jgi:inosine-uridine nucleoside N-ribohydrolase
LSGARRPRRIHIDTDPGLDDLLALALALGSAEVSIEGVTTVAGNAGIDATTENAQRFLALAGVDVPLGRGAAVPLGLSPASAEPYHGADGRRGIRIPAIDRHPLPSAREVMRQSLAERGVEVLLALGPLTNVAALIEEDAGLFEHVEIVWMGGSLSGGNVTPVAEFNCYADPTAAEAVLASGFPVRVVGLDVTRAVRLCAADLDARPFGESEMARLLHAVLSAQMDAEEPVTGERIATLHDPCALFACCSLDLFRYEPKELHVAVEEGRERGRLSELPRAQTTIGLELVHYAVEVDTPRLARLFLERLSRFCGAAR